MKGTHGRRTVMHTVLFGFVLCPLLTLLLPDLGLAYVVYPAIVLFWCVSVRKRIVSEKISTVLTKSAALMLFWLLLKTVRSCVIPMPDTVSRLLWYAYGIPMLLIPLLSFRAARMIGQTDDGISVRRRTVRSVVGFLLIAGFLSNDLHGLTFRFDDGPSSWKNGYRYGILFYLSVLWMSVLLLSAFLSALRRSSLTPDPGEILIPLASPAVVCIGFCILPWMNERLPIPLWEVPDLFCFMVIGFWEGLISIGLVPSNEKSGYYFNRSRLSARIADRDGRTVYISDMAVPAGREPRPVPASGNRTVLHRYPISGGEVVWEEDRSGILALEEELLDVNERLAEESDLLKAENRLKEEQTQNSEKNRIYDDIARSVERQTDEISALVREAKADPDTFVGNMAKASFLTAYIKRKANLALRAAGTGKLNTEELIMSIHESLEYLGRCGPACMISGSCSRVCPAEDIIAVYDAFETAAEAGLPSLAGVMVKIAEEEKGFSLSVVLETPQPVAEPVLPGFSVRCTREDDCVYIRIAKNDTEDGIC